MSRPRDPGEHVLPPDAGPLRQVLRPRDGGGDAGQGLGPRDQPVCDCRVEFE